MDTIISAVLASHLAEAISWLNKKLAGTPFQGKAAFLIAVGMALVVAVFKEISTPGFSFSDVSSWQQLYRTALEIFGLSQVYFQLIVKTFGLDTKTPA